MSTKILCVDDDANILAGFQRALRKQFSIDIALGPEEGLAAIGSQGPYAVVVSDMQMPGMNGIQFLMKAQEQAPDTVRVMLTGNADQKTAMDAVNQGRIFRFLTKPCSPEELALVLKTGMEQYRLITAEREVLGQTLNGSIKMLTDILSIIDPQSFGFGQKLRDCMSAYARQLKIAQTWDLELAAMLCQVGYVTIPAPVLAKFRANLSLKSEEKDMLARVPRTGSEMLSRIPRLENVANIILYQNKNFDGTGFPMDSTKGEEIPIGARVLRVLTDLLALEALGHSRAKALTELQTRAASYDPRVLESVSVCFDVFMAEGDRPRDSMSAVTLTELRVGHLLVDKIETCDGVLIVGANTLVTPMLLEKLRNFSTLNGIREPLYVETKPLAAAA